MIYVLVSDIGFSSQCAEGVARASSRDWKLNAPVMWPCSSQVKECREKRRWHPAPPLQCVPGEGWSADTRSSTFRSQESFNPILSHTIHLFFAIELMMHLITFCVVCLCLDYFLPCMFTSDSLKWSSSFYTITRDSLSCTCDSFVNDTFLCKFDSFVNSSLTCTRNCFTDNLFICFCDSFTDDALVCQVIRLRMIHWIAQVILFTNGAFICPIDSSIRDLCSFVHVILSEMIHVLFHAILLHLIHSFALTLM